MVFIALNNNNEIIFAHNSSKGKYKCIYCNEKIFFVNKSKNNKIAHFKHNILCKYSESINNNYDFYTNEFHFKWTRNLVKPEYLYGYWNNKDIADVINTNKIRIIIRRQLLKENYYMNDENLIWILDGELRNGIIKQITYENNEIKYYFCNDNLYDLKMISSKHKIYIDYGLNQIIEIIPENIKFNYCICNIININDFITMYFDDIIYNPIEYINENLKIQELYGYNFIENKIAEYNKEIKNEQIMEENKYKLYCEKLKNYIDNYNNLFNADKMAILKIDITHELTSNYDETYCFLYDEISDNDIDFYNKLCIDYHIFTSDFKYRRSSKTNHFWLETNSKFINKSQIETFEELNNFYTQYCKKINTEYNKINKLIIDKYINKLDFTHNIKCINCKISLKLLTNDNLINITENININNIKEFNSCQDCKILCNSVCNICDNIFGINFDSTELKLYNKKYYHLDCYSDNIICRLCNLKNNNFKKIEEYHGDNFRMNICMHDLCFEVYEIIEIKCIHCNKNILNNDNFKYIDDSQLNNIIQNFNNDFIVITPKSFFKEYIHINCINFSYFFEFLASNKQIKLNQIIYDKLKLLNKNNVTNLCNLNCFMCNKKQFRLNLNRYTFEEYMLYLDKIKICKIKRDNKVYNYYNINDKDYAYLCYICKDKIKNNDFYNKFFFDNLEKEHNNISEKQINILNKIKQMCNT
jgi:hypothetical protein